MLKHIISDETVERNVMCLVLLQNEKKTDEHKETKNSTKEKHCKEVIITGWQLKQKVIVIKVVVKQFL